MHSFWDHRIQKCPCWPAPPPKRPRLRGWDDETGETLQRRSEEADWRRCGSRSSFSAGGGAFLGCFLGVTRVVGGLV